MVAESHPQLEIHWVLEGGCLRLVETTRQPQPVKANRPSGRPKH